jgi:ppGpp synthetase/RelA/SpoT-type nucleotidyltranferase
MPTLEEQYSASEATRKRLEEEAMFIVRDRLRVAQIKTHSLVSRVKTLDSVRDKALRKNVANPLIEFQDLVGLRVVCLLRSDIERIGAIIRSQFSVLTEDNKIDGEAVEAFGYQSVHFVCKLPPNVSGPRYSGLSDHAFEIQVRTLAMDAWASLSHYLDYKSEPDVPRHLRKDFFALSGLFYVADTHFEMFYADRMKSRVAATQEAELSQATHIDLNFDTLKAYLRKRFPAREEGSSTGVSELVSELAEAGYTTIDKLDNVLERSHEVFLQYEKSNPPSARKGKKYVSEGLYADIGVVRLSLAIVDKKFAASKYASSTLLVAYRKRLAKVERSKGRVRPRSAASAPPK